MKLYGLGYVDTILPIAAKMIGSALDKGGSTAPRGGTPGVTPGVPIPGGAVPASSASGPVTVSPAFQQSFTPQFSPVMQMAQDSPGLTQSAAPTQYASPSMTARTSAGVPGGAATPGAPGLPLYDAPRRAPSFPEAFPDPYARPVIQQKDGGMTDLMKTGLLAVAAIGAIKLVGDRKKNKK
jgi:hypothetical protein